MAELREHLTEMSLENIQTYIQSGNIIFDFAEDKSEMLEKSIRKKIDEKYGFDVSTRVKTVQEIRDIVNRNPFLQDSDKDINRIFITFLSAQPSKEAVKSLKAYAQAPEEIQFEDQTVYFYSPGNYARAKLNNNFLEAKLKPEAATHNLKTLNKLLDLV